MALSLTQNLDLQSKTPNFARDQFKTLAAMKAYPETSLPEGHLAYCLETSETYQYKSANTADAQTGKWRVFAPPAAAPDLSAYATKSDLAATDKKAADAQTAATAADKKAENYKGKSFSFSDGENGSLNMALVLADGTYVNGTIPYVYGSRNGVLSKEDYTSFGQAYTSLTIKTIEAQAGNPASALLKGVRANKTAFIGAKFPIVSDDNQAPGLLTYADYSRINGELQSLTARVAALEKSAASAGSTYE